MPLELIRLEPCTPVIVRPAPWDVPQTHQTKRKLQSRVCCRKAMRATRSFGRRVMLILCCNTSPSTKASPSSRSPRPVSVYRTAAPNAHGAKLPKQRSTKCCKGRRPMQRSLQDVSQPVHASSEAPRRSSSNGWRRKHQSRRHSAAHYATQAHAGEGQYLPLISKAPSSPPSAVKSPTAAGSKQSMPKMPGEQGRQRRVSSSAAQRRVSLQSHYRSLSEPLHIGDEMSFLPRILYGTRAGYEDSVMTQERQTLAAVSRKESHSWKSTPVSVWVDF